MIDKKDGWIDIGELLPRVSVHDIAAHFRFDLGQTFGDSGEQRTRCPVVSCDGNDDFRSVSINVSDPKGKWKCHRSGYGCGAAGDKLSLIFAMENGAMPASGKLVGRDFRAAAQTLQAIADGASPRETPLPSRPSKAKSQTASIPAIDDAPNVPLRASANESVTRLASLDDSFVLDPSDLPPAARRYLQSREWMTKRFCQQVRCGYLPSSSKGTLRGKFVFGVLDDKGEVLSWVGRDLRYTEKHQEWESKGRSGPEPAKYKFPSKHYFRRKFELYGQEQIRREENHQVLSQLGLTITEGFNDVNRLRSLGVPSVGIMSNRMTQEQIAKTIRIASEVASGKVNILFDADIKGDEGAKETLWQLAQAGLDVRLAWSRAMEGELFADREPESITEEEWSELYVRLAR